MSMNRFACGLVLIVAVSLGTVVQAEDLAKTVAVRLRDSGTLDGYRVKVRAKQGTVWLEGQVSDAKNISSAIGLAESTVGVERVVNRLTVASAAPARQSNLALPQRAWDSAGVSPPKPRQPQPLAEAVGANYGGTQQTGLASGDQSGGATEQAVLIGDTRQGLRMPARMAGLPRPIRSSTPVQPVGMRAMSQPEMMNGERVVPGSMQVYEGPSAGVPVEAIPVPADANQANGMTMGVPRPMGAAGVGMPPVPMRGDGPNMPNYAWPSYASYPNYAALQYPTQYSPTAWPYIGPFYPYPQVPLGWRRVSLEWDDGWWYVDFDERHIHSHHR